jgi:hypothetical protein
VMSFAPAVRIPRPVDRRAAQIDLVTVLASWQTAQVPIPRCNLSV